MSRFAAPDYAAERRSGFAAFGLSGWLLVMMIMALAGVGTAMLYSAAELSWQPWASAHAIRFGVFLIVLLGCALVPLWAWREVAYIGYAIALLLLIGVALFGVEGMGAQRWLQIGPARIQPSEIMKITLVIALARYYHDLEYWRVSRVLGLIAPLVMIGAPVALVITQPDLGTSVLLAATGFAIVFLAGLDWRWMFWGVVAAIGLAAVYLLYFIEEYQLARISNFLNPEADIMGAGYHRQQSIIAIGSGGATGKGFGRGTQTQLDFLPEKQTDFIYTVIAEEFGLFGGVGVLVLCLCIIVLGGWIAATTRSQFGRLCAAGASTTFALYVVINTAMVMGLIPVVGVPLPLVSYGGTVMLAVMIGFGLTLSARLHRHDELRHRRR